MSTGKLGRTKEVNESVMQEAIDIIYGDREKVYGHPSKNLNHIAHQWSTYLMQKHGFTVELSAEDVCWMMVDLKKCRQMNTEKRDNLVDAIGYLGLIERLTETKTKIETKIETK